MIGVMPTNEHKNRMMETSEEIQNEFFMEASDSEKKLNEVDR